MVVMVMAICATRRLRQILDVGQLSCLRGVRKVVGQLVEFTGSRRVALRLSRLRRVLQVGSNLPSHLLVFGRIGLLELLQRVQQLSEGRKLAAVAGRAERGSNGAARCIRGRIGGLAGSLDSVQKRLEIGVVGSVGNRTHAFLVGILVSAFRGS